MIRVIVSLFVLTTLNYCETNSDLQFDAIKPKAFQDLGRDKKIWDFYMD